jgi:hypothetical protein
LEVRLGLAATNKSLAQMNKSRTGAKATKKRLDSVHDEHRTGPMIWPTQGGICKGAFVVHFSTF